MMQTTAKPVNIIIGLKFMASNEVSTNCPLLEAMAAIAEPIPKPIPLKGRGKISVTNKKKIEK
jgi:hypothetical protein